jgi:hypothetical protein
LYANFYRQNFEKQRMAEAAFGVNIKSNIRLIASAKYERLWYTQGYMFHPNGIDTNYIPVKDNDFFETSIEFKWNIRERVMQLGEKRVSKGTKFPRITLKVSQGIKGVFESDFAYLRLHVQIEQRFLIRGAGKLELTLTGDQTFGNTPLVKQQIAAGTSRDFGLMCYNTFETAMPSEFFHSAQSAFFVRMLFNAIKTKPKWNEPQFSIHHAIGYGEMKDRISHNTIFSSMDKGFYEGGLMANDLLKTGFVGVGIGLFYRYGYYSDVQVMKNFVPKLSVKFTLD